MESGPELHDWWGKDNRKWDLMVKELVAADPDLSKSFDEISALNDHTQMAAVEWVVTMRAGLEEKERSPDSIHIFKYEDLCNRPEEALDGLLRFCELESDDKFLSYARAVLKPNPTYKRFDLHRAVLPAFMDTLARAGY